jgi:hypothetical protein
MARNRGGSAKPVAGPDAGFALTSVVMSATVVAHEGGASRHGSFDPKGMGLANPFC